VGDVIMGVGLRIFHRSHQALGANRTSNFSDSSLH